MGQRDTYQCNSCTYRLMMSGKPDMGIFNSTKPFICEDCHEIMDLVTERRDFPEDSDEIILACESCGGHHLIEWNVRTKLCPKCGGTMEIDQDGVSYFRD